MQFGGQTPLNLALELKRNGVPIIGTAPESIDLAEDRRRFGKLLDELKIPQPQNGTALAPEEAVKVASEIGLPVLVRPSYVLGGRAMVIAYDLKTVQEYVAQAALMGPARSEAANSDRSISRRRDGSGCGRAGRWRRRGDRRHHGAHRGSGHSLGRFFVRAAAGDAEAGGAGAHSRLHERLAQGLKVVGLMNVQYAIQRDTVYVLEVNPRARAQCRTSARRPACRWRKWRRG